METSEFLSVQDQQLTPLGLQTSSFCPYLPHLWKPRSLWLPQLPHGQEGSPNLWETLEFPLPSAHTSTFPYILQEDVFSPLPSHTQELKE